MKKYIKYIGVLALGIISCEPEFENPVDEPGSFTNGEADFTNYVALGNSLTAGYADNALYITGQENSYPNIMAQQFAKVGGGEFDQPLMADNTGGLLAGEEQIAGNRLVLETIITDGETVQAPKTYFGQPTTNILNHLEGEFNNMGVPGAKSYHLLAPGYGDITGLMTEPATSNPYFVRFATSPETSVIQDAVVQEPTFFSLWIGNNDVLGFATSGGVDKSDITPQETFASAYGGLVQALTSIGAEGILANVPDVTDVPYFTTVPYAPLDPSNPDFGSMVPVLNSTFAQLNPALLAFRGVEEEVEGESEYSVEFSTTNASQVIIQDKSLENISEQLKQALMGEGMDEATATVYGMQFGQVRQATADDLLILTSSSVIGQLNEERMQELMDMGVPQEMAGQLSVNGVTYPLEDQFVLIPGEQELIATATQGYNETIHSLAEANGLAFLNAADLLSRLAGDGITFDDPQVGVSLTSQFGSGGAFSLDGIHLTPRGYALVANKMIEEINKTYNSDVPKVNIGNFATVTPSNNVQ